MNIKSGNPNGDRDATLNTFTPGLHSILIARGGGNMFHHNVIVGALDTKPIVMDPSGSSVDSSSGG